MTANRINPFVSTNPEAAAQVVYAMEAIQTTLAELKTKIDRAPDARTKRALKQEFTAGNSQLEFLKTQMPKTYVDEALAIAAVVQSLGDFERKFEMRKAEFMEVFTTNPKSALDWRSADVVEAQTKFEQAARLLEAIQRAEGLTLRALLDLVKSARDYALEECLREVRDSHSTSPFDVAIERVRAHTLKEFSQNDMMRIVHETEWMVAKNEETAHLRPVVSQ